MEVKVMGTRKGIKPRKWSKEDKLKLVLLHLNEKVSLMQIEKEYTWEDKIYYENHLVTSPLSDAISKDLQKRGMKFVGSTIIYSFLQAVGIIYSHEKGCFLYKSNV